MRRSAWGPGPKTVLTLLVATCWTVGCSHDGEETIPVTSVTGTVDLSEVGGNGLSVLSAWDTKTPVSANGGFQITVSEAGIQILGVVDEQGRPRALALRTPGTELKIDAESTAEAMLFFTPGLASADPAEGGAALERLRKTQGFTAFVSSIRQRLPTDYLATIANDAFIQELATQIILDASATTTPRELYFGPARGKFWVEEKDGGVELVNQGWRFVRVQRLSLDGNGKQVGSIADVAGGFVDCDDHCLMNGAVPYSWGSVFEPHFDPSTADVLFSPTRRLDSTAFSSGPTVRREDYWVTGPGHIGSTAGIGSGSWGDPEDVPPAQISPIALDAYGVSAVYYIVFPLLDVVAGVSSAGVKIGKAGKTALDVWSLVSVVVDLKDLAEAETADEIKVTGFDAFHDIATTCLGMDACKTILKNLGCKIPKDIGGLLAALGGVDAVFGAANFVIVAMEWSKYPRCSYVYAMNTPCEPSCSGKVCGDDGCGGSCGICADSLICYNHGCITPLTCPEAFACARTCSLTDTVCASACLARATKSIEYVLTALSVCVVTECLGTSDTQACIDAATQEQCIEQYQACAPLTSVEPSPEVIEPIPDEAEAIQESGSETCGPCPNGQSCNPSGTCETVGCGTACPPMVTVPAGAFWMGCNSGNGECPQNMLDEQCGEDEHPCHEVTIPAFEIDKYEVAVSAFAACVDAVGCLSPTVSGDQFFGCNWGLSGRSEYPMNCISWSEARTYCLWAGGGRRLCTEAEWEKAARGIDGRLYPWGNADPVAAITDLGSIVGNFADQTAKNVYRDWQGTFPYDDGYAQTAPIGLFPAGASPFGAEDMSGNVAEMIEDGYWGTYTGAPIDGSSVHTMNGIWSLRGGDFSNSDSHLRASARSYQGGGATMSIGFRCCRWPP